jgi:hypothetical protein
MIAARSRQDPDVVRMRLCGAAGAVFSVHDPGGECLPNGRQPRAAKAATFARSAISAVREAHRRTDAIVTIVRYE